MDTQLKISSEQISAVAARGAVTMRALSEKNAALETKVTDLEAKVAGMEREQEVRVIAVDMEAKGLNTELTFDEKVASISKHPNLEVVRESVKMASGEIRIASPSDKPGTGAGTDALTALLSGTDS